MLSRIGTAISNIFRAHRETKNRKILLGMCMGDAHAVERLIAGQRSRNEGISKDEACRRAIHAIQRDNR